MLAFYLSLLETDEDRALFMTYFNRHEQNMMKIVMKILRNQEMAEDAVQTGWLNLINNFEKFVHISMQEKDGYIVSIMKNAARDIMRRERRLVSLEEWDQPVDFKPVSAQSEVEALIALIRQLPEPHRTALGMFRCFGDEQSRDRQAGGRQRSHHFPAAGQGPRYAETLYEKGGL